MKGAIFFYIILCLLSFFDFKKKSKMFLLIFTSMGLFIGLRGYSGTDSHNYIRMYNYGIYEFPEKLFIVITEICRRINLDYNGYFIVIAFLSMLFLWGSLLKINKHYIMVGFLVYYVRFFFLRDFNQIRYGLAINIIMLSIFYFKKKWKFLFLNLIAILVHKSVLAFFLMSWLFNIRISSKKVFSILGIAFLANFIISGNIENVNIILGKIINQEYITVSYGISVSKGYSNPILWYQLIVLIILVLMKKYLYKNEYYEMLKNIYMISFVVLVIFMPWGVVSGRISSIFSTVEIFIFPLFISGVKNKIKAKILFAVVFTILAYINIYIRLNGIKFFV